MYFDTPRDFIGGVYETLLYGDQPLGWDIIGRKETVRGATQQTFLDKNPATAQALAIRQMAGFDREHARAGCVVPAPFEPAVGRMSE